MAWTMRRTLLVVLAACSFRHGVDNGGVVDSATSIDTPPSFDDAGHEIDTWTVDTAADFEKASSLVDIGIDPWGSLTPAGYYYGAFMIVGANTALWHTSDASYAFDATATATPAGAAPWFGPAIVSSSLTALGITNTSNFSAWVLGEIYLQPGNHVLRLEGADIAFLEVAPPHTAAWSQIAVAKSAGSTSSAVFSVAVASWYQFRIGWSNSSPSYSLDLQHSNNGSTFGHFARNEMRARADGPRGLLQTVYMHQLLLTQGGTGSELLGADALGSVPSPLYGEPFNSAFSVRWAGQFYAQQAGTYTFSIASQDGDRVETMGSAAGSNFTASVVGNSKASASLNATSPGWYDIVFDVNSASGNPSATLQLSATPETALMNQPLPLARLRSVEPPTDRIAWTSTANGLQQTIPDRNQTTVNIPNNVALSNETITSVVARALIYNPEYTGLTFTLDNGHGTKSVLDPTAFTTQNNGGFTYATYYWPVSSVILNNATVGGPWSLTFADSVNSGANGAVYEVDLTLHTSGGPQELAVDGLWVSQVVDTTYGLVSVDSVSWVDRPTVLPAKVRLRSCDVPCTNEAWSDATNGAPLAGLEGHRYLQAEAEIYSDGSAAPELEQLQIVYRRNTH
jgi:hypothetical protein